MSIDIISMTKYNNIINIDSSKIFTKDSITVFITIHYQSAIYTTMTDLKNFLSLLINKTLQFFKLPPFSQYWMHYIRCNLRQRVHDKPPFSHQGMRDFHFVDEVLNRRTTKYLYQSGGHYNYLPADFFIRPNYAHLVLSRNISKGGSTILHVQAAFRKEFSEEIPKGRT